MSANQQPKTYTRDAVLKATNDAANWIQERGLGEGEVHEVINLVVNLTHGLLDDPGGDEMEIIRASYDRRPETVLAWSGIDDGFSGACRKCSAEIDDSDEGTEDDLCENCDEGEDEDTCES